MFMFPPSDLARVKRQLPGFSGERGDSDTFKSSEQRHNDSSQTGKATLIRGREILHHTQQYIILDESAVAPGTMTARQRASNSSLHLAGNPATPTQSKFKFPSTSSLVSSDASLFSEGRPTSTAPTACSQETTEDYDATSWLNTLPIQHLVLDLRGLNLHLSTRVTEILGCAEAMWEWICEYQDAHRSYHGQHHTHKEHSHLRSAYLGERSATDKFNAELEGMSRAEFDVLLTRFELCVLCFLAPSWLVY
jgi:hypothetical protein